MFYLQSVQILKKCCVTWLLHFIWVKCSPKSVPTALRLWPYPLFTILSCMIDFEVEVLFEWFGVPKKKLSFSNGILSRISKSHNASSETNDWLSTWKNNASFYNSCWPTMSSITRFWWWWFFWFLYDLLLNILINLIIGVHFWTQIENLY